MAAPIYRGGAPFIGSSLRTQLSVTASAGTAVTLKSSQSNGVFLFDVATNFTYTLPTPKVGSVFTFLWTALETGGQAHVITATAPIYLTGAVMAFSGEAVTPSSTLGPYQFSSPIASTYIKVTCNGTTTGGGIGQKLVFTGISATIWSVSGHIVSPSGNLATPFSV